MDEAARRDRSGTATAPIADVLTRGLRRLGIGWRVALIGVVNLIALLVLGAILWFAAADLRTAWGDLRAAHAASARIGDLERAAYRLHREVRTFFDHPDEPRRVVVEAAKSDFTGALWRAEDETRLAVHADIGAFAEIARRYLFAFDDLRGLEIDIRLLYENDFPDLETALRERLDALDLAIRPGDVVLRPLVAAAYDRFAEIRVQIGAYRHFRDHGALEAARSARDAFALHLAEIGRSPSPDSRGYAVELFAPHVRQLDGLIDRLADIADARARFLTRELEGSRAGMVEALAQAVALQKEREEAAIEHFEENMSSAGDQFVALAVAFLAISVLTAILVVRSIRQPLWEVRRSLIALISGDAVAPGGGVEAPDEVGATARQVEAVRREVEAVRRRQDELAALERRWLSVLETSPIGISVQADDDGRILFRNARWRDLFRLAAGSSAMPGHDGFVDWDDADAVAVAIHADTPLAAEMRRMARCDASSWWGLVDVRPIDFSGAAAHMIWISDVTDRARAEEAMRAAKERAEAAFADLARAQAELVEAERLAAIGGLVAGVAHEINNPVGIGLTVASSLGEKVESFRDELARGALKRSSLDAFVAMVGDAARQLVANLARAGDLVQSFKQVAVDRAHPDRRSFDLAEATEQIAASLRPSLKASPLRLEVAMPPGLVCDGYPGAWGQVLTNLFVNAQMHAFPEGSAGTMVVSARPLPGGRVEIVFADDGQGMPAEVAKRAFEPFFTTRRGAGGTGLGLHIVRNIVVHRFGGTLRLVSTPGEGTRFEIAMPLVAPDEAGEPPATERTS